MTFELDLSELETPEFVLPRYLRYARTLALLSGAAVGIAAGVATISITGCVQTATGSYPPPPSRTQDSASDLASDGRGDPTDGGVDLAGGGPRPAPRLPCAWLA